MNAVVRNLLRKLRWRFDWRFRHFYHNRTSDSPKWNHGHNVGCCWWAADDKCICDQVQKQYGPKLIKK